MKLLCQFTQGAQLFPDLEQRTCTGQHATRSVRLWDALGYSVQYLVCPDHYIEWRRYAKSKKMKFRSRRIVIHN